jgi:hypothetical protein
MFISKVTLYLSPALNFDYVEIQLMKSWCIAEKLTIFFQAYKFLYLIQKWQATCVLQQEYTERMHNEIFDFPYETFYWIRRKLDV